VGEVAMKPMRSERLRQWGTAALVLLLVHGLGAARSAWAGCNHLVVSKSDRLLGFHGLDALMVGGSSSAVSDDQTQDPLGEHRSKQRTPCAGPGCSSRVPVPVSTASQGSGGSDQWVVLNAMMHLAVAS